MTGHPPLVIEPFDVRVEWQDRESEDRTGSGYFLGFQHASDFFGNRIYVIPVRGAEKYHLDALQSPALAPGSPLQLVPESGNPVSETAVGIWDEGRSVHVGYVPSEFEREISVAILRGDSWSASVAWEWRSRDTELRTHLGALVVMHP